MWPEEKQRLGRVERDGKRPYRTYGRGGDFAMSIWPGNMASMMTERREGQGRTAMLL